MLETSVVRELARYRGEPVLTSFYLDVDGRSAPRPSDVEARAEHLYRVAREKAAPLGKAVATSVDEDLRVIREWLGSGIGRGPTRGVAVFSCSSQGFFRAFRLPVAVTDHVGVGPEPEVGQLCTLIEADEQALVVLVDRWRSRIFRLGFEEIGEVDAPVDEQPRQVDTDLELGTFQHHEEELARQHVRKVAQSVAGEIDRRPVDRIVLGGSEEAVGALLGFLPRRAGELVIRMAGVGMSADPAEIAAAAREAVGEAVRRARTEVLEELRGRAQEDAGAVTGLPATLDMLGGGRVGTLVVARGFRAPGGRCSTCGLLTPDGGSCPTCGGLPVAVDDVVDAAIGQAFARHVKVEVCEPSELAAVGAIGAIERYGRAQGAEGEVEYA